MPPQPNHYELLGVPKTASVAEIKKRYRELVRKYHPDVNADKAAAEKRFVEITEAYKVLVDPYKRSAYDATLVDTTQRVATQTRSTSPPPPPRPGQAQRRQPISPQVARIIKEAELAFIRRRLGEAAELCKKAILVDKTCARAHAILGDVYRARKKHEAAINAYSYAVQYDPADQVTRAKLEKLLDRAHPLNFSWETPEGRRTLQAVILNLIGWGIALFMPLLIYIYPGEPIWLLADLKVPLISKWSWHLVWMLFGDGALIGFLLAVNGLINHPDEELIFESGSSGKSILPTGFLLLVFSPFFFLGVAILYLTLAIVQDAMSKSIVVIFAAVGAIVLMTALLYPVGSGSVLLLGGNVTFIGTLAGWYIGAALGPGK